MNVKKALLIRWGAWGLPSGRRGGGAAPAHVPVSDARAFCFAKSSERLHAWFTGTSLYKKNLESYMAGRAWTGQRRFA